MTDMATRIPWEYVLFLVRVVVFGCAVFWYVRRHTYLSTLLLRRISWVMGVSYVLYAFVLSTIQYIVWARSPLGEPFITLPLDKKIPTLLWFCKEIPGGYFIHYSVGRFFLPVILAVVVALAWGAFLHTLKKHKGRFFDTGDIELAIVGGLVVGWPGVLVYIVLSLIGTVCIGLFRAFFQKEHYTTIGLPVVIAAAITLLFSGLFISLFNIGVLVV